MMLTKLLLLFCLTGHVFAKEPPDVDCLIVHLKHVHCSWKQGTPAVNYTFNSKFHHNEYTDCSTYLWENNTITGCNQPYLGKVDRFSTFYTKLGSRVQTHELKSKVKLNPPTNLTIQQSDDNLLVYWNQTTSHCVESEARYSTNNKNWETNEVATGKQTYTLNLFIKNVRYEVQVRSRLGSSCGKSEFWSDWSEPVAWGFNNSTVPNLMNIPVSVWTPMLYVAGALVLIILVIMLLHHERLRIIPVVPKPSLIPHDIQDWLQLSKGMKESFKDNYIERACPVREYCHVSLSDSETSDSSTSSVTTDQTDCSISVPVDKSDGSTACSSSSSKVLVSSEEAEQVPV